MRELNNSMKQRVAERMIWRPFMKFPARSSYVIFLLLLLVVGALVCTRLLDSTVISGSSVVKPFLSNKIPKIPRSKTEYPVNCTAFNPALKCPANYPTKIQEDQDRPSVSTCPEYFRWIHEDFRPWARTGISRDMVERAKSAHPFASLGDLLKRVVSAKSPETFRLLATISMPALDSLGDLLRAGEPSKTVRLAAAFCMREFPIFGDLNGILRSTETFLEEPFGSEMFLLCLFFKTLWGEAGVGSSLGDRLRAMRVVLGLLDLRGFEGTLLFGGDNLGDLLVVEVELYTCKGVDFDLESFGDFIA